MVAWMDDEALRRTLTTGRATYWSRSRGEYWVKGETSGNRQWVREVGLDCDGDALLVLVDQEGAACHTGERSCFYRVAARCAECWRPAHEVRRHDPVPRGVRALDRPMVPVTRRLLADSETAVGIYRKLAGNRPGTVLLESAEQGKRGRGTASSASAAPACSPSAAAHASGWASRCPASPTTCRPTRWPPSARWPGGCARPRTPGLPPLTGGLVGYLGYDVVRRLERLPDDQRPTTWACPSWR